MSHDLSYASLNFAIIIGHALVAMTTTRFVSIGGTDVRYTMTVLYGLTVRSAIECIATCQREALCVGTNYKKSTGYCELIKEDTNGRHVAANNGTRFMANLDIVPCASSPCGNGGTCTNDHPGYACKCKLGYTGDDCSTAEVINMARQPGTSVSCSSALRNDFRCEKAVDGNKEPLGAWLSRGESDGAWVKVVFPKVVEISHVTVWHRCMKDVQYRKLEFEFSDGSTIQRIRNCDGNAGYYDCSNQDRFTELELSPPRTTGYIKLTGRDDCRQGGNNGFIEVIYEGTFID